MRKPGAQAASARSRGGCFAGASLKSVLILLSLALCACVLAFNFYRTYVSQLSEDGLKVTPPGITRVLPDSDGSARQGVRGGTRLEEQEDVEEGSAAEAPKRVGKKKRKGKHKPAGDMKPALPPHGAPPPPHLAQTGGQPAGGQEGHPGPAPVGVSEGYQKVPPHLLPRAPPGFAPPPATAFGPNDIKERAHKPAPPPPVLPPPVEEGQEQEQGQEEDTQQAPVQEARQEVRPKKVGVPDRPTPLPPLPEPGQAPPPAAVPPPPPGSTSKSKTTAGGYPPELEKLPAEWSTKQHFVAPAPLPRQNITVEWPVLVFTITQDYYTYTCEWMRSVMMAGMEPHLLGFQRMGDPFPWGQAGKPLYWLIPHLQHILKSRGDKFVIFFTDAHDSLVLKPAKEIVQRFLDMRKRLPNTRVLLTAERSCFPIPDEDCNKFPQSSTGPYRFLNSGGWIGAIRDVIAALQACDNNDPKYDDQKAFQYLYLDNELRERFGLVLDSNITIFQAMHMAWQDSDLTWREDVVKGQPVPEYCNVLTGGCPAVVHFNGGSKHLQVEFDERAEFTKTFNALPQAAKDKYASIMISGQSGGPDAPMSMRDFCCGSWTIPNSGPPKQRPGWLGCPA